MSRERQEVRQQNPQMEKERLLPKCSRPGSITSSRHGLHSEANTSSSSSTSGSGNTISLVVTYVQGVFLVLVLVLLVGLSF